MNGPTQLCKPMIVSRLAFTTTRRFLRKALCTVSSPPWASIAIKTNPCGLNDHFAKTSTNILNVRAWAPSDNSICDSNVEDRTIGFCANEHMASSLPNCSFHGKNANPNAIGLADACTTIREIMNSIVFYTWAPSKVSHANTGTTIANTLDCNFANTDLFKPINVATEPVIC